MRSERYFKEVYSRFWKKRVIFYGRDEYLTAIMYLLLSRKAKTAFELAIGTGWPVAAELKRNKVDVEGCDIADILIKELKEQYPDMKASVAGYETLETDKKYELVYCLRSTWYFRDILRAVDKMISITAPKGTVIFDVMNKESCVIKRMYIMHYLKLPLNALKNMARFILNTFFGKDLFYTSLILPEIPASPGMIDKYLQAKGVKFNKLSYNQIIAGGGKTYDPKSFRVLYICEVQP